MSQQIGIKTDEGIFDLQTATEQNLTGEPILYDNSLESLEIIRHSTAHLMAEAIKKLYPEAKFYVGPTVDEGFYYDFKVDAHIGEEDLKTIEKTMKKLSGAGEEITKYHIPMTQAREKFADDHLKQAVMNNIPGDTVSIYNQGAFEDLCRGPHAPNTKYLKHFKLTKISGAYLGGDQNNEMLTRIYGIAFADKESLDAYLKRMEEALKRDHRKIGNEMGLFKFFDEIGGGLPVWLPAGARLRGRMEQLLYAALRKNGYQPVRGPEVLKSDLWKVSGHYQNYGENMYFCQIDEQEYGMKPMNCVGHIKAFESGLISYRDLPLRYFEFGTVHRHEQSGVLHGLLRVREFTQDDAHIFCTEEQIQEEILSVLKFVDRLMKLFDFDYEMEVSTRPEKAIGAVEMWDKATAAIKGALDSGSHEYGIDEGGGAFYGPKIDIKITDAIGRKWQCGTIQVDFNLPERFRLEYVGEENEKKRPVMIHRAILGSFERFIAILTEHYGGEFPLFIAPTQVIIIPVKDDCLPYAKEVQAMLQNVGADVEINAKNESLNKRIRTAEKAKAPMILVLGLKEMEERTVAIRDRRNREQREAKLDDYVREIKETMDGVHF